MSFSLIVFNFLLCRFEAMVGWVNVHAQFKGEEPHRLKVQCLGVTLRGLKCNALFNYLIILLDVMIYVYILYGFDDYVTYL